MNGKQEIKIRIKINNIAQGTEIFTSILVVFV